MWGFDSLLLCYVLLERVENAKARVIECSAHFDMPCDRNKAKRITMDLAQQAKIIDSIHDRLSEFVGQKLRVKANMGRSKIVESDGVLTQVHPRLFIMEMNRKRGRTARQSYQYVDILTGTVELSQNGEPLFDPFIIEPEPELPPLPTDSLQTSELIEERLLA